MLYQLQPIRGIDTREATSFLLSARARRREKTHCELNKMRIHRNSSLPFSTLLFFLHISLTRPLFILFFDAFDDILSSPRISGSWSIWRQRQQNFPSDPPRKNPNSLNQSRWQSPRGESRFYSIHWTKCNCRGGRGVRKFKFYTSIEFYTY